MLLTSMCMRASISHIGLNCLLRQWINGSIIKSVITVTLKCVCHVLFVDGSYSDTPKHIYMSRVIKEKCNLFKCFFEDLYSSRVISPADLSNVTADMTLGFVCFSFFEMIKSFDWTVSRHYKLLSIERKKSFLVLRKNAWYKVDEM